VLEGAGNRAADGPRGAGVTRDAAGVFVATAAGLAITFLTYVVIARALGPDGRGVVAVLQADAIVAASLLGLGVPWALFYHASQSREAQPVLLGIAAGHAALLTLVSVALAVLAGSALADAQDVPDDVWLYVIAALLVPATFLEYAFVDMLRGLRRFALANRIVLAGRALGLVTVVALVAVLDAGLRGAIIAVTAASVVQVLGALPVLARRGIAFSRAVARRVGRYGVRAQGASVSRLLSRRFDVLVLSLFAPAAVVGQYAIAQTLAELTLLVPQALGLALSPMIIRGEAGVPLTQRLIRVNGTLALVVVVGLAATASWSVELAFGTSFEPAVVPLLILLPGAWMFACGDLVAHVLAARGRPGTASLLSGLQAVLTIGLDLALVPAHGIEGAAVASAISYSVYGLASIAVVARHDGVAPLRLLLAGPQEVRRQVGDVRGGG
jgi:O-antigen/teichoic acid export membrane protein